MTNVLVYRQFLKFTHENVMSKLDILRLTVFPAPVYTLKEQWFFYLATFWNFFSGGLSLYL